MVHTCLAVAMLLVSCQNCLAWLKILIVVQLQDRSPLGTSQPPWYVPYFYNIVYPLYLSLLNTVWRGRAGRTPILGSTQELVKDCGYRCINGRQIVRRKIERENEDPKSVV